MIAEAEAKPVRVELKPEIHDLLRLAAAKKRMSMAAYARFVVEESVVRDTKGEGRHS